MIVKDKELDGKRKILHHRWSRYSRRIGDVFVRKVTVKVERVKCRSVHARDVYVHRTTLCSQPLPAFSCGCAEYLHATTRLRVTACICIIGL